MPEKEDRRIFSFYGCSEEVGKNQSFQFIYFFIFQKCKAILLTQYSFFVYTKIHVFRWKWENVFREFFYLFVSWIVEHENSLNKIFGSVGIKLQNVHYFVTDVARTMPPAAYYSCIFSKMHLRVLTAIFDL